MNLNFLARNGRFVLVAGLVAGVGLPSLAAALAPWVPYVVGALLLLNAFRSGNRIVAELSGNLWASLWPVLALQLVLPIVVLLLVQVALPQVPPFWFAAILMMSAPALTGAPNFIAMTGHDPAGGMRLLVLGTLVFPATALVVLWAAPGLSGAEAFGTTLKLAGIILIVVVVGILSRRWLGATADPARLEQGCDGIAAVLLGVVVVGLMAEVGPMLRADPARLAFWVLGALVLNLALQIGALFLFRFRGWADPVAASVVAGNRNTALYLLALNADSIEGFMLFIGCYQIPMYLTPLMMRRLHARHS